MKGHFEDDDPRGEEEERIQHGRKTKRRGKKTNGETQWDKKGGEKEDKFQERDYIVEENTDRGEIGGGRKKKKQESSISQTAGSQVLFVSWQTGQKHRDTNILSVMQQTSDG